MPLAAHPPLPLQTLFYKRFGEMDRAFLDLLPVAVCVCDREGRVVDYNRAAGELWGHAPERGEPGLGNGGSYRLLTPAGDPMAPEDSPMAVVPATGEARRGQAVVIERYDGSRRAVRISSEPIVDAEGQLVGTVNVLLDMTERQATEERLRHSEARYRAIFDNAQVSVWEVDFSAVVGFLEELRRNGVVDLRVYLQAKPEVIGQAFQLMRITGANAHTLELFEADHEDELLKNPTAVLVSETERSLVDVLVALRQRQQRLRSESVMQSLKGRRLDVVFSIAFDGKNAASSVVTIQDITQRKAAELEAQNLAAIVESSDDAIISMDMHGTITSWNAGSEHLYGYAAEEALGRPVSMLIPSDHREDESMILASIGQGKRVDHYETQRRRSDGSVVNISLTVSPIEAPDGTIVGASKIARDITERVEAQQQQQVLLREMNHRVKNLLTLSSGLVSLSARYARTPEELATAVQERLNALARAHEMILPSTVGNGREHDRSTTLHALVRTIVLPYDAPVGDAPSRILVGGCDTEIAGRAVTSFALLLHEFATNAAKYGSLSAEGGHVEIHCAEAGDALELVWKEIGGPTLGEEVETAGFGSVLSRATVNGQLRGELVREWHPEGLLVRLTVPKERLTS